LPSEGDIALFYRYNPEIPGLFRQASWL